MLVILGIVINTVEATTGANAPVESLGLTCFPFVWGPDMVHEIG